MDSLSCHKVKGVAETIEGAGAFVLYLPPYSPDRNSIEMMRKVCQYTRSSSEDIMLGRVPTAHPSLISRKSAVTQVCAGCGTEFTDYAEWQRKYCSHKCYIADRCKAGDVDEQE